MARHRSAAICALLSVLVVYPQAVSAFESPLSESAVREAYFLGQRNDQKTSDLLKLYTASLPLPDKGPYISEIRLLTPYAQVVTLSSQKTVGYSAQQAASDYHGRGDTLLLQVRIEFTPTFTYEDAVRTASDTGGELNRYLEPEDFWQAFRFKLSQNNKSFEPRDVHADPLYAISAPRDSSQTLQGAIVWLEFDASQFESQPTNVEVITPATEKVSAKFDLATLR
jgi:hypothetical protein